MSPSPLPSLSSTGISPDPLSEALRSQAPLCPFPRRRSPFVGAWVGVAMPGRRRGWLDAEAVKARLQQLEAGRTDVGGEMGGALVLGVP